MLQVLCGQGRGAVRESPSRRPSPGMRTRHRGAQCTAAADPYSYHHTNAVDINIAVTSGGCVDDEALVRHLLAHNL